MSDDATGRQARSAFVMCLYVDLPRGETAATRSFEDLIPEGYRFEIATVSGWTEQAEAGGELRLGLETCDEAAATTVPCIPIGGLGGNQSFIWEPAGIRATRAGVEGRNLIRLSRAVGSSDVSIHVKLVGHLVGLGARD